MRTEALLWLTESFSKDNVKKASFKSKASVLHMWHFFAVTAPPRRKIWFYGGHKPTFSFQRWAWFPTIQLQGNSPRFDINATRLKKRFFFPKVRLWMTFNLLRWRLFYQDIYTIQFVLSSILKKKTVIKLYWYFANKTMVPNPVLRLPSLNHYKIKVYLIWQCLLTAGLYLTVACEFSRLSMLSSFPVAVMVSREVLRDGERKAAAISADDYKI